MKTPWWRKRWVIASASGALLVLLLVLLLAPTLAKPFVQARLQAAVDEHLNARVEIDRLSWSPLWGATVHGFRLVAIDPQDGKPFDLLRADRVAIALDQAPFGDGPIIAKHIAIFSAVVRVIETADGIVGVINTPTGALPTSSGSGQKLSQQFQLHDLQLTNGQFVYEERTGAVGLPMIWHDLTVRLQPVEQFASKYACTLAAKGDGPATLDASGAIDVDLMSLQLDRCTMRAAVDGKSTSIPTTLRALLSDLTASGEAIVNLTGSVPLDDPLGAALVGTVEIPTARATLPDCPKPLDTIALKLQWQTMPIAVPGASSSRLIIRSTIDQCVARAGDASVQVLGGTFAVNGAGGWGASDVRIAIDPGSDQSGMPVAIQNLFKEYKLAGKLVCTISGSGPFDVNEKSLSDVDLKVQIAPEEMSVQPRVLPVALTDFGEFEVRVTNGLATAETIRCGYGNHVLFLQTASVTLADLLKSVVKLDRMKGCITFAKQPPEYPAIISQYVPLAEPRGPFWFEGTASIDLNKIDTSLDYDLRITTDRGAISTLNRQIPMFNIHTDIRVTPKFVEVARFNADVLSGTVSSDGKLNLEDMSYTGQVNLRRIDLNSLAQMSVKPGEKPITVTGELSADAKFNGKGVEERDAIANLKCDGAVQVIRGELFRVPVLVDIAHAVHLNNLATVGEAGATFRIGDGKLHLLDAAVGAPAIGVRAKGQIDLLNDYALNVDAIANPFSDWDRQVRRDNNPVANVAGSVLGKVQKGLDNVTQEYLYKVRVTGTIADPKTEVITAPAMRK